MRDYSMDELEQMQEKALERVQNMRLRSKELLGDSYEQEREPIKSNAEVQYFSKKKPTTPKPPPKTGRISMPLNLPKDRDLVYPSFKESFGAANQQEQQAKVTQTKASFFDSVLKDPDESLLFCLLLLLKSEGQNENLLLALLYILF